MHVAIYTKNIPGKTAKAQEADLRWLCQQQGWTVHKVYADLPVRQRKPGCRTARVTMIDDLLRRKNKFGVVCVWRLGMLGHCIDDILWLLEEVLVKRHIQIVALGDGLDTTVGDGAVTRVLKALAAV